MSGKKFLSKTFAAGISVIVALSCMAMTACGGGDESQHEHSWSTTYSHDDTYHWLTCSGCDQISERGTHTYSAGECTVCGYEDPDYEPPAEHVHVWSDTWTHNDTYHWHECTDANCDEITDYAEHVYVDGVCECGYEDPNASTGGGHTSTPLPEGNKIYLVGDSTVCSFTDNYYMPRYGYGTQIAEYFNVTSDQVVNLAVSGRSSLSFLTDSYGNYDTLENTISEGDYLIIGFGHNDEKSDSSDRYTDPSLGKYQDSSLSHTDDAATAGPYFQYVLYENYIKLALDNGATPILCTPIVRYSSSASYTGSKIHDTEKGDYSAAIRELGEVTNTTVIDLTSITKAIYESDNEAAALYHAHTTYELDTDGVTKNPIGRDDTHINKYGAQMVAYQLANALLQTDSTLKDHVKENISAPSDPSVAINTSYIKPDYQAPNLSQYTKVTDLAATETTSAASIYRSAFGNVGGATKYSNYTVSYADGKFTMSNSASNGKINDGNEGLAMAFIQVDKSTNFKMTATATVTATGPNVSKESAFGLMLRDDMYLEGNDLDGKTSHLSNSIAAGVFYTGETTFYRENSTLTKGSSSGQVTTGTAYELTIERTGQEMKATVVVNGKTYTQQLTDFDMFSVDNDYMYVGMFIARDLTVEFTNVSYVVTGDYGGA